MIARIWRGTTRATDADSYVDALRRRNYGYPESDGYLGVLALRAIRGNEAEFVLVTLWESAAAIEAFAGSDPAQAVFYPEDDHFLIDRGEHVEHFEVLAQTARPAEPD